MKIKLFNMNKHCKDCFGEYDFYFYIFLWWQKGKGLRWLIQTVDYSVTSKNLRECLWSAISHIEEDSPRYYRLTEVAGYDGKLQLRLYIRELKQKSTK